MKRQRGRKPKRKRKRREKGIEKLKKQKALEKYGFIPDEYK